MPDELTDVQRGQWFERGYNKGRADVLLGLPTRGRLLKCPQCECYTLPADDERWCERHGEIPLSHDVLHLPGVPCVCGACPPEQDASLTT